MSLARLIASPAAGVHAAPRVNPWQTPNRVMGLAGWEMQAKAHPDLLQETGLARLDEVAAREKRPWQSWVVPA